MYKIAPLFAERIWGGNKLKEKFHFEFDKSPVGEAWLIADVPLGTSWVEGADMPLDKFYEKYQEEYFGILPEKFPLRATIIDPADNLSVQLHPTEAYALKHEDSLGKPEAWYVIESEPGGKIQFGHTAKTKEEFIEKATGDCWDELLSYVDAEEEKFLYVGAGILHAVGKGVICYEIARNADITYRVYDYNRVDKKTGKPRDLHLQKAFDNLVVPFAETGMIKPAEIWQNGVGVIEYYNKAKEFIFRRIRCNNSGYYQQSEFGFYTVGRGNGRINHKEVKLGDTYFIPKDSGTIIVEGDMDLLVASYRDQ